MIRPEDEARLIAGLRGDATTRDEALRELFELTRTPLYSLALRMTGRADLADDAVQEAFVDLLRSRSAFRGDARLTTWLFRIVVRAATRVAARSRGAHEPLPEELGAASGPSTGASDDPSTRGERREAAARILRAIRSLPAPQRAVLALSALQDLPQVEIAAILGVPEGTVHSRLHHAKKRLRERLEQDGPLR